MPLLHKQKFIKKPIPSDLDPNQEIFYCKLTQEIFLDYDEYFERTILCNSLVWTCSLSGKSGLTYSEALQSEDKAKQSITLFPRILEKVVVYLALFTKRGNIKDLLDDVFAYIKDRYFIGEMVTVVVGQLNNSRGEIRKTCKIVDVIPPVSNVDGSEETSEDDDEGDNESDENEEKNKEKHSFGLNPLKYKYLIETQSASGQSSRLTVHASQISRPKGLLTKDKVQIILKMSCEAVNNIWVVKDIARDKYSLNNMKFEQIFKGEPPKFDVSFGRGKFSKLNQIGGSKTASAATSSPNVKQLNHSHSSNGIASKHGTPSRSGGKSNQHIAPTIKGKMTKSMSTSAINHHNRLNNSHSNKKSSLNTSASAKLSSKIKKKYSKQKPVETAATAVKSNKKLNLSSEEDLEVLRQAAEREVRMLESQKLMDRQVISMNEEEFALWHEFVCEDSLEELFEIEVEYEKIRRKEERDKERERLRVEKRTQKEYEKELKKPKEDLECEKLQELPKAIALKTKIPTQLFGDAMMIVEFLNGFGDLFEIHADFPNGFSLEMLEDALYSKSCHSALCNLLLFYLDWIFKCYDEENFEDLNASSDDETSEIAVDSDDEDISIDQLYHEPLKVTDDRDNFVRFAEKYAKLIRGSQGRSFRTIGLDVYTISEMLRLYFLTSGSLHEHKIKFWYQQRGGYTHLDDAGIDFAIHESELVKKLETVNVYELEAEEKLKILSTLCHQLITHVRFRDVLEDNFQRMTTLRAQLRDLQTEENKRLREQASHLWKKKLEEKAKQKTRLEEIKTNVVSDAKQQSTTNSDEEYRLNKKQADESAKKREEFVKKERQLLDEIYEAQIRYSLQPLGKDRYYRRYWIFKSIPGVFVEDDDQYVEQLVDSLETIKHEPSENMNGVDNGMNTSHDTNSSMLSNEHKVAVAATTVAATTSTDSSKENHPNVGNNNNYTSVVMNCSNILSNSYFNTSDLKSSAANFKKGEIKWSFHYKADDLDKLINSLTERGLRESELKQNLIDFKAKISEKLAKCPHKHLSMSDEELDKHAKSIENANNLKRREFYLSIVNNLQSIPNHNSMKSANPIALAHDYLESDFRDKILDIEEQIYNGVLGSLKVTDRIKWKSAIEKGHYDPQCTSLTWADLTVPMSSHVNAGSEQTISEIISDLSKALLQIEQAVERRFLRTPLSDVQKTPDKQKKVGKKSNKKDAAAVDEDMDTQSSSNEQNKWQTVSNWEKSLMNCTSLSQLFLHLQTLDESIAWSKSALNARCRLCRKKGDADKMLLCDKCDRGHHIYCLRPRLKTIPDGEWFCPECRPKDVEKTPRKMRKAFVEDTDLYSDGDYDVDMRDDYENVNNNNNNSDEDVNIDDSYDDNDAPSKQRKSRKRKLAGTNDKSADSDIAIAPAKTRGRPPSSKQQTKSSSNITAPSVTSNDSNHSTGSKSKKQHNGDEYQSEDELNGYETASSKKRTQRNNNGVKSPVEFHLNNTSSRNSELTHRLKITEKLVADLMKHADAWPFLKPVTKREAPDYFEVIKRPMDFASIKNNINHFKYTDYTNILDDIKLIFANCRTYNEPSSDIYKTGQRLNNFLESQIKKLNLL